MSTILYIGLIYRLIGIYVFLQLLNKPVYNTIRVLHIHINIGNYYVCTYILHIRIHIKTTSQRSYRYCISRN